MPVGAGLTRYSQLGDGALGDHGVVGEVGDHRGSPPRRPPCPAASGAPLFCPRAAALPPPPPSAQERPRQREGPGGTRPAPARTWRRGRDWGHGTGTQNGNRGAPGPAGPLVPPGERGEGTLPSVAFKNYLSSSPPKKEI